ncbi:MAG: hypothetical protein ACREOV_13535, partial [Candidatus Dormibacteraceae bacterium]
MTARAGSPRQLATALLGALALALLAACGGPRAAHACGGAGPTSPAPPRAPLIFACAAASVDGD